MEHSRAGQMCKFFAEASVMHKPCTLSQNIPTQLKTCPKNSLQQWYSMDRVHVMGPEYVQTHCMYILHSFEAAHQEQKDCARGSPLKTRYSGHHHSRPMRDTTKHAQTAAYSYHMGEGWKGMKERLCSALKGLIGIFQAARTFWARVYLALSLVSWYF